MSAPQLNVLIIGGGIGGLAAAVFLRPFAKVTVLEAAKEFRIIGASITVNPGVMAMLRAHGLDLASPEYGGVSCSITQLLTPTNELKLSETHSFNTAFGIHRSDIHDALFKAATKADGNGRPAEILLGRRVASVDVEGGSATLEDGTSYVADVIVGADGIRSRVRPFVTESQDSPVPTGESAYRLLVNVEDLKARAPKHSWIGRDGLLKPDMFFVHTGDRRAIAYPCKGRKALNFGAYIADAHMHEEAPNSWTHPSSVESLLTSFSDFSEQWTSIMKCGQDIALWQMRDMKPLSRWVNGRTILIGDAAHPMLPHRGAGANSAIEDAEAISHYLKGVSRSGEDIHAALQRAFRVRFRRTARFQLISRREGIQGPAPTQKSVVEDMSYFGAARWEMERPDMVLKKGETVTFELRE